MAQAWIEKRKTKKGWRFYVRWRDEFGHKGSTPAGPKRETAIKIRNKISEQEIHKRHGLEDATKSVSEFVQEFLKNSKKTKAPNTVKMMGFALRHFKDAFRDMKLVRISTPLLERFKQHLLDTKRADDKERSRNGVAIIMRSVRSCLSEAVRLGYIQKNPMKGVQLLKPVKVARFLNPQEIVALLAACEYNSELREIVTVALHTGLRRGELLALDARHIVNGDIYVHQKKTDKPKVIPVHEQISGILTRRKDGPVFPGWSSRRLAQTFRRAANRAKLGRVRFHDLRHTFASSYLQNGGTLMDLAEILGVTLPVLQIYSHFQQSFKRERINRMVFVGQNLGNQRANDPLSPPITGNEKQENLTEPPTDEKVSVG